MSTTKTLISEKLEKVLPEEKNAEPKTARAFTDGDSTRLGIELNNAIISALQKTKIADESDKAELEEINMGGATASLVFYVFPKLDPKHPLLTFGVRLARFITWLLTRKQKKATQ